MTVSNIIVSKELPRRTMLRAGTTALALPYLNVMAEPSTKPKRFVAICASLGLHLPNLIPSEVGHRYTLTPYLELIKNHRKKFTLFSGISHPQQQGNNGHASELTWLTSAQRPGLAGFKNTISIDQMIANQIGHATRFPYMALSTSGRSMSWNSTGVEIPGERSPEQLFKKMFMAGTEKEKADEMKRLQRGKSILDTVLKESKKLDGRLGHHDRQKFDEYTSSIRALEIRLTQSQSWVHKSKPQTDHPPIKDVRDRLMAIEHQELMYDVMALALKSDSTRTITFQISGMNAVPLIKGVATDWHNLSHHGKDLEKIKELTLIEKAEFKAFDKFLEKLDSTREGAETLLDHTAVLYGSNLGNASAHDWHNLGLIVAGGEFKHAGHLAGDPKNNTVFANLLVSLAQHSGLKLNQFGSSTRAGVNGFELG